MFRRRFLVPLALLTAAAALIPGSLAQAALLERAPATVTKRDLTRPAGAWVAGEVIVKFRPGVSKAGTDAVNGRVGASVIQRLGRSGLVRVQVAGGVLDAVGAYGREPLVEYAEPNFLYRLSDTIPTDPKFPALWGLRNTGQAHGLSDGNGTKRGKPDADIDAPEAWDTGFGSPDVVVAVIDSGVDLDHPDLAANLWTNPGDPAGGGDDDNNGFIDDVHGADFVRNDGAPNDENGHGSHVSGTIAAVPNNGIGVVGVCPGCRVMALKAGDAEGTLRNSDIIRAITYAIRKDADIINGSFGGGTWSQALRDAFERAGNNGILAVLAAGNESMDNDMALQNPFTGQASPAYPASHRLANILSVAAATHKDQMAFFTACDGRPFIRNRCFFSNWGRESVDVAAPGVDILSTVPNDAYDFFAGTSMATPHVAGAAGLVLSRHPNYNAVELKNAIMNSADTPSSLNEIWPVFLRTSPNGKFTVTTGRLNLNRARNGSTRNATPSTDGNIDGALRIVQQRQGAVAWPADVNDVFKKALTRNRTYRVTLNGPNTGGRDIDVYVWKPGTTEIWQLEASCPGGGQCKLRAAGATGSSDERVQFRAVQGGVYYFHVTTFYFQPGTAQYTLRVVKV